MKFKLEERIIYLIIAVFAFAVAACGLVEGISTKHWLMILCGSMPLILIALAVILLVRQKN